MPQGQSRVPNLADPYFQSGKAKSAHKIGVRMVTEQVFLYLLDHMQAAAIANSMERLYIL
jgi:hypothetical protein